MHRANRVFRRALRVIGEEVRVTRRGLGLSQARLGQSCGLSGSEVGRIERGQARWLTIEHAARIFAALGLELSVRGFPSGDPIRDGPHDKLLTRLEARLHPHFKRHREWPVPIPGDMRAIDLVLGGLPKLIAVEAETVIDEINSLQRRLELKRRDSGIDRMVLLVRDTDRNRDVVRSSRSLREMFPLGTRTVLAALAAGRDPGANGIVFL